MKLLSAAQIRDWDAYTIQHEPISSIHLMNRAAHACFDYILKHYKHNNFHLICGPGNNGGDGLAISILLNSIGKKCYVYILETDLNKCSLDFQEQFFKVQKTASITIINVNSTDALFKIGEQDLLVDAIFGTGLSRPLEGLYKQVVQTINELKVTKVSIDLPSGMIADCLTDEGLTILKANETLTFQVPKRALLFPETGAYTHQFTVLDIALLESYIVQTSSTETYIQVQDIKPMIRKRSKFAHKGSNGHALLIAGGTLKGGAALMAAEACLRIGSGLLSVKIPAAFYNSLLTRVPEAMLVDQIDQLSTYKAAAIGPGIDRTESNKELLVQFINQGFPLVVDADAIHLYAQAFDQVKVDLLGKVVFTPHIKEFEALIGHPIHDSEERVQAQIKFSIENNCYILLKGAHSILSTPEGLLFYNSTGNPGMAKGGSGDVLTGIILGLLAQGYPLQEASLLGMYIHGFAGDIALNKSHEMYMNPTDTIHCIGEALCELEKA